jgi:hypothetical protein
MAINIGQQFLGSSSNFGANDLTVIGKMVQLFLRFTFVLAGLILLFYFILGGIGMISSAGKSDPKAAEQAKATITSAVIGFVVVFTAYWIVKLIATMLNAPNLI